jgi:serine/threonine-protein kinase
VSVSGRGDERRTGEIIGGKYRVVRFLAAGGMGVVYEAQHTVVKRRFAVKFLRPELTERRESLARFQREAQTAGALESENLTAAVDFGIAGDGSPYIVMEYLVGESVEALLDRDGRLPLERATDLVQQACRGIQAAHAAGIVHRDLKPQNLFLCRREDGTDLLKVLDFGIAKLEAADRNNAATETGAVLGTPAYMSPEQARGEKSIDHRADVYALGAILYELLSGRKPHPGDSHNAILHHIATQPAVPLDSVEPELPAPLVLAIGRTLFPDPEERFASAELFGQEISKWAERRVWPEPERQRPSPVHEASEPTELAPPAVERAHARTVELMGSRRGSVGGRRSPKVLLVALAGAAALVGLWFATRSPAEEKHVSRDVSAAPAALPEAAPVAPEVNAAEAALPVAATAEPAPAPNFEPKAREVPRARAPAPKASPPEPSKSAPPLAFDRRNPYD